MVTYSYVPEIPSVNLETGDTVKDNYLNIDSNISEMRTFGKTSVILEYPKKVASIGIHGDFRLSYMKRVPFIK